MTSQMEVSTEASSLREAGLSPEEKARVGKIVARLRQRRKLSQLAVARAMGVSRSHLCNIEAGRNRATATQLVSLAEVLNTSVDAILDGPPPRNSKVEYRVGLQNNNENGPSPGYHTEAERFWLRLLRAMEEAERDRFADEIVRLLMQKGQTIL